MMSKTLSANILAILVVMGLTGCAEAELPRPEVVDAAYCERNKVVAEEAASAAKSTRSAAVGAGGGLLCLIGLAVAAVDMGTTAGAFCLAAGATAAMADVAAGGTAVAGDAAHQKVRDERCVEKYGI